MDRPTWLLCFIPYAAKEVLCSPAAAGVPEGQEEVAANYMRALDTIGGGNILRHLDTIGGGNILRESKRGFDAMSGLTFGKSKKNFDEIDRSGFGRFVRRPFAVKKNIDEIDNVGF